MLTILHFYPDMPLHKRAAAMLTVNEAVCAAIDGELAFFVNLSKHGVLMVRAAGVVGRTRYVSALRSVIDFPCLVGVYAPRGVWLSDVVDDVSTALIEGGFV